MEKIITFYDIISNVDNLLSIPLMIVLAVGTLFLFVLFMIIITVLYLKLKNKIKECINNQIIETLDSRKNISKRKE